MNKKELIVTIAEKVNLTQAQAELVLQTIFNTIQDVMVAQDAVTIPGFGSFSSKSRAERKGRNPSTGKEMLIPSTRIAAFKAASRLKEAIKSGGK